MEKTLFCALIGFLLNLGAFAQSTDTLFKASVQDVMKLPIAEKEEETVTTASKKAESVLAAPASMTVITSKEIEVFGALNLGEVLDRVTSMYAIGNYFSPQGMMAMRGTATQLYNVHLLILLDGRPIREIYRMGFNQSIYASFPLQIIDKIEIIRGSGSVLYGSNAYTDVINIITKKLEKNTEIKTDIRYGSFQTWQGNLYVGKQIGKLNVQAAFQIGKSEGWDFTARGETDMRIVNGKETIINAPKTIKMATKGTNYWVKAEYAGFKLQSYGLSSGNNVMNQVPSWANPIYQGMDFLLSFTNLSYQKQWNEKWDFQVNIGNSISNRKQLIDSKTNPYQGYAKAYNWLAESSLRYKINSNLDFLLGGTTMYMLGTTISPNRLSNGTAFNLFGNETNPDPYKTVDHESENWYTGYFQIDYQIFPFLKIDVGGQINKTAAPKVDFVPRFNLVFNHKEKLFAKILYGEAFRSPSLPERYNTYRVISSSFIPAFVGGGKDLQPEKIRTAEIQLAYKHKTFQFTATYFNSLQSNLLIRSLPKDSLVVTTIGSNIGQKLAVPKYINRGELASQGVELESKISFLKKFYFTGSFSWFKVGNGTLEQQSMGMPNTMLKIGLIYEEPQIGMMVGVFNSYFGAGDDINSIYKEANPVVKPYHSLSANISLNIKKFYRGASKKPEISLNLYGTNLLDEQVFYPEYARRVINSIPGRAGRAVYLSLRAGF